MLKTNNGSLYQKIFTEVNYAFEKFKEKESTKNQENSKDPKIFE